MNKEHFHTSVSDEWMDAPAFCSYVGGIKEQTAALWRCTGRGPLFTRVGRKIRYRKSVVDAWLESRTGVSTTALDAALSA